MNSYNFKYVIRFCMVMALLLVSSYTFTAHASGYNSRELDSVLKEIDEYVDNAYPEMDPALRESFKQQIKDQIAGSYVQEQQDFSQKLIELQAEDDEGKEVIGVDTKEDFLEWVCFQLRDHKEEVYYDTNLWELYNNSDGIFEALDNFYCEGNPIISSCYLDRYEDKDHNISCSWYERYVVDEYKYRIGIKVSYLYTKEEMDNHRKYMAELAKELQGANDYESVKAVNEYLAGHFEWGDGNSDDIVGFKEGKMDCIGYAMATFALLTEMNIPVRIVEGKVVVNDQVYDNCWNIVEIDGKWYNLDVSWNDNGEYETRYDWFLRNNEDFVRHVYGMDQADIKNMISETSYPLEEGLFIAGEVNDNQNTPVEETDNKDLVQNSVVSLKNTVKKFLASRVVSWIILFILSTLAVIIRNRVVEQRLNGNFVRDDLSSEIAEYYKRDGRYTQKLEEKDRKHEKWLLVTILLYFAIVLVLMGAVYYVYSIMHK